MNSDFYCRIEADSINQWGDRLTTFVVTYPRIILAEVNTHRVFSRNTASSRAIPAKRMIENIKKNPYIPYYQLTKNEAGMQGYEPLSQQERDDFRKQSLELLTFTLQKVEIMEQVSGIHKQFLNRHLEPWMWTTQIISSTDYNNFFALRTHKTAHPDIQRISKMMYEEYIKSEPVLRYNEISLVAWHLPFITEEERAQYGSIQDVSKLKKISAGRCARVSYEAHDGTRSIEKDIELCDKLTSSFPIHPSPLEHQARPYTSSDAYRGNFNGWKQFRSEFSMENITEFNGWED